LKSHSKYQRLRVFAHMVWRHDSSGKRTPIKQAWRVAGIATGEIEAIPDEILKWWWKIQDLLPANQAGEVTGTAEKPAPSAQEPGPARAAANKAAKAHRSHP
jgi:hypothetical protein